MIKFKLMLDKDKETEWLNEMSQKGYALTKFFAGFYTFEKCEPGKYIYQIDFGEKFYSVSDNYKAFMDEMDVEIVQTWGFWVILRKEASKGSFELYTDVDSSIEHYNKILIMFKVATIIEIICFMMEIFAIQGSGDKIFILFAGIIAVLIIAFINIIIKTKKIISELKARKGIVEENSYTNDNVSKVLLAGLLLNPCAMCLSGHVHPALHMTVQILAIVLMLIGLFQSRNVFKK